MSSSESLNPRGGIRYVVTVAVLATIYWAAARAGLSLAFATKQVSAVWPPTGIALAAYAVFGLRVWPGIYLGALVANAAANESLVTAAGIAVGNTLAGVVGMSVLRRLEFQRSLGTLRDVLALIGFGAVLGSVVSASNGVLHLVLGGLVPWSEYAAVWRVWWVGDVMGVMLFAPLLLTWKASSEGAPQWRGEFLVLMLTTAAVSHLAFSGRHFVGNAIFRLEYAVFPFVIWAAIRFTQREAASVGVLVSMFAVWGAIHDRGPFASGTLDERLVLLELFMAVTVTTALTLGAVATERRRAELALQQSRDTLELRVQERTAELAALVKEREVLLQEIHHRVKNNLQVISSLINMQLRRLKNGENREALEACQARVQAIALIHEKLYQSADYSHVPFSEYARGLASIVFQASGARPDAVSLDLAIENVDLTVDKAIPCGLVMNELITNALKHGFTDGRHGTVRVELARAPASMLRLTVRDDGIGLPEATALRQSNSLGLQLVSTLAQQLEGKLEIAGGAGGAVFQLTFPAAT